MPDPSDQTYPSDPLLPGGQPDLPGSGGGDILRAGESSEPCRAKSGLRWQSGVLDERGGGVDELSTLVERSRGGDLEAYGEIVRRFQDMACGYAYALLGDFHLAQDAAQEAFVQGYRSLGALRDAAAFPGWFRRVVLTHCDRIRRRRRPARSLDGAVPEPTSPQPGPVESAERNELSDQVLAAVRSLPEHQRTVTTLFYINGWRRWPAP
jgi:RNA polymerase sigma factor (sigma-70 family)